MCGDASAGDFNTVPERHLSGASIPRLNPDLLITESTYATSIREDRRSRERQLLNMVGMPARTGSFHGSSLHITSSFIDSRRVGCAKATNVPRYHQSGRALQPPRAWAGCGHITPCAGHGGNSSELLIKDDPTHAALWISNQNHCKWILAVNSSTCHCRLHVPV